MAYTLILGDYAYSSWSLRGWLLFERFGLACASVLVDFSSKSVAEQLAAHPPARTVPTLLTEDGAVIWDSLAIAEELASRHPDAGHWPKDPGDRALARSLAAEMHSGFGALREDCPMNLRAAYLDTAPSEDVLADLCRLQDLWAFALKRSGGPWLCGDYSVADAFFAPVAARIATYNLPVDRLSQGYVTAHLADPAFRRWRALGLVQGNELPWYARDFPQTDWPGPKPLAARAVPEGPSQNASCPYSGDPVTDFLEFDGRVFGFCNAGCRDKTVADPEAWPAFMAMARS